jgi:hypothetical protein
MKGAWALKDIDENNYKHLCPKKMLCLKFFPISRLKSPKLGPNPPVHSHATPSGEDKTPMRKKKK